MTKASIKDGIHGQPSRPRHSPIPPHRIDTQPAQEDDDAVVKLARPVGDGCWRTLRASGEGRNRLVRAEEGTLSGGSISSRTRDQQWTLTQVGNWDLDKVDLNGDGDFLDAEELEDARTHNAVNELNARDIDSDSSDDYSLAYDEAGNLTDDGESYTYEWDAFYRLRKIRDRSTSDLVAEYIYNGQGYRISIHEDTDDDGDVDASDKWFHHAFDERWRWVATFREDDSDPKEEFLHHAAGLDGQGTGSYIDLVVLRDRDINSGWTSAADGTLEERIYYCQNWRADVSALVTDAGQMLEWVKYSAYGVPFGLPGGDADSDGDCDASDVTQVDTWVEMGPYDVRGDVDLDGDVNEDDSSVIAADYSGIVMGRGVLSDEAVGNRRGLSGAHLLIDGQYENESTLFSPRCGLALNRLWRMRTSDNPYYQIFKALVSRTQKTSNTIYAMTLFPLDGGGAAASDLDWTDADWDAPAYTLFECSETFRDLVKNCFDDLSGLKEKTSYEEWGQDEKDAEAEWKRKGKLLGGLTRPKISKGKYTGESEIALNSEKLSFGALKEVLAHEIRHACDIKKDAGKPAENEDPTTKWSKEKNAEKYGKDVRRECSPASEGDPR